MDRNFSKSRAIVFVTDAGFLLPSLLVAQQVSMQADVLSLADIFILLVDIDQEAESALNREFSDYSIKFIRIESSRFLSSTPTYFNKTHISQTTLGRFIIHEVLPENYEHIVYLDGDLQILGDILPMIQHNVPIGKIAAGNDHLWLCEGDRGKFWRDHEFYLGSLGIKDPKDYFNAGVLAFHRRTWKDMAPKALKYFNDFPTRCIYHDQSALNAVFLGKREIMSPEFNFNTFYAEIGVTNMVSPRIIHFTGGNKPWRYAGPPWNGRFISEYRQFYHKNSKIISDLSISDTDIVVSPREKSLKSRFNYLISAGRGLVRRRRFRTYLQNTVFPF